MAAAFQAIERPAIGAATATIGTIQRIAGSLGTALLAITLQHAMAAHLPGFHGSIGGAAAIAAADPARALPALAQAFGVTFWVAFALTVASLVPALALPGRRPATAHQPTAPPQKPQGQQNPAAPQLQHTPKPAEARR
jgi:hypothetical protein